MATKKMLRVACRCPNHLAVIELAIAAQLAVVRWMDNQLGIYAYYYFERPNGSAVVDCAQLIARAIALMLGRITP